MRLLALLALLALVVLARTALAGIFICTWRPWTDSPENHGYGNFCVAHARRIDETHVEWHCEDRDIGRDVVVADLGYINLNRGILRFRAGCPPGNGTSWGRLEPGGCYSEDQAVCIGLNGAENSDKADCYYVASSDDCTWPEVFSADNAPQTVEIWGQ